MQTLSHTISVETDDKLPNQKNTFEEELLTLRQIGQESRAVTATHAYGTPKSLVAKEMRRFAIQCCCMEYAVFGVRVSLLIIIPVLAASFRLAPSDLMRPFLLLDFLLTTFV